MRAVLCGAVVLCLVQSCTAIPLEEFVGYPFNNETHQVFHIPAADRYYIPIYYSLPVNTSVPFIIDGRESTRFRVSHFLQVTAECYV